jgi:hypothetical protein
VERVQLRHDADDDETRRSAFSHLHNIYGMVLSDSPARE